MGMHYAPLQNLQQELDTLGIDEQLQALAALTKKVRKVKKARQHAAYERARYHSNLEYKKRHNQRTTEHIIHKYATDLHWRAKVREQQKEYYYRRKAQRQHGSISSSPQNV